MKSSASIPNTLFQRSAICAALVFSFLGSAQALTLSRPTVQSKQGEVLRAEIDIIELTSNEEVDLQVSLASADPYRAARMDVPRSNGNPIDLQVQLLRRPDGRAYLKLSSSQAVATNFIDVLLVLNWATGRSLRNVSLALDDGRNTPFKSLPPVLMSGDASPTASPSASPSASSSPSPLASPGPANITSAAPASRPEPASPPTDNRLGVQQGDTASALAKEHLEAGVSLDQMLLAMLRSNPSAFVESNVNRLKTGALLTLPSAQEATTVSREEAHKAIKIQADEFREYRARLAASKLDGALPKAARASEGKLEAQISNKPAPQKDKLTLTKPSQGAPEEKIAKQLEVQDVASRASEISRNIADLSKIVAAASASSNASDAAVSLPMAVASVEAASDDAVDDQLKAWMSHPLAPLGAGGLISAMALIGLWLSRGRKKAQPKAAAGLPPLNVNFDLDLPQFDNEAKPSETPSQEDVSAAPEATTSLEAAPGSDDVPTAARPTMAMPNVSLDLDLPSEASPFQVRIDLAEELWKLGQKHTSRALMEEVMQESEGAVQAKAKQWLADRG
jgi:FimV-like protein